MVKGTGVGVGGAKGHGWKLEGVDGATVKDVGGMDENAVVPRCGQARHRRIAEWAKKGTRGNMGMLWEAHEAEEDFGCKIVGGKDGGEGIGSAGTVGNGNVAGKKGGVITVVRVDVRRVLFTVSDDARDRDRGWQNGRNESRR